MGGGGRDGGMDVVPTRVEPMKIPMEYIYITQQEWKYP